ncbi:MAG: hypothetical protein ACR2PQ_04310, partial [Myxococcota bacterium]
MRTLIVLVVLWLLPIPAAATDLILGAEIAVEWDDNVLSRSDEELDDFNLRYGPRVELEDSEGRFRWSARYNPDYQDFFDLDELDGWDHDARLAVDWDISRRTSVHFSDHYIDVAQFSRLAGDPTLDVPLSTVGREGLKRNQADFDIDHYLAPRHLLGFGISNTDSDFEGERADTNFWQARLEYTYIYTARTRLGWILSAQHQEVDRPEVDTVDTNYFNLSLQWIQEVDPTLSFSISAGPAVIDRDANEQDVVLLDQALYPLQRSPGGLLGPVDVSSCPTLDDGTPVLTVGCEGIPFTAFADRSFLFETTDLMLIGGFPDDSTSDVTYFASASLIKEWTHSLSTSLRYRRSAVATGGQGGQVSDVVVGTVNWRPM